MILSTVHQTYFPCLLGPRHGWIVRTFPPPPLCGLGDENGQPALYQRCRFLSDDGEIWCFYCWPLATDEEQQKAVDDYLYALKRRENEATHEEKHDLPNIVAAKQPRKSDRFTPKKPTKPADGRIITLGETA